jgi:hydroxymethylbilane synthase
LTLRIGTRGSVLALAQARSVAHALPEPAELVTITTAGDVDRRAGDKSRWVGALEAALLAGEIDLAVHSAKDVPGELAEGTAIVAVPPREDPRDVLVGVPSLDALPSGARVGTSALRRRAQLLAVRKLAAGEVDALVLAAAGLRRLDRADVVTVPLEGEVFVPAPGQGSLAVQARLGRRFDAVCDAGALAALEAERTVVRRLGASCHTPVGVHAGPDGVRAFAGLPDGAEWIVDEAPAADALGDRLLAAGAADLLARAEAGAGAAG